MALQKAQEMVSSNPVMVFRSFSLSVSFVGLCLIFFFFFLGCLI